MEQQILYTLPAANDATEHTVLRLTIGVVTALGMARYRRLMRDHTVWLRDTHGVDADAETPVTPEQNELQDVCYRRGYMLASLKKAEIGTCAPDDEMPSEWKLAELPVAWQSIEGFIDGEMPGALFNEWDAAAVMCNPDTFFVRFDDEKKRKPGGVTVI